MPITKFTFWRLWYSSLRWTFSLRYFTCIMIHAIRSSPHEDVCIVFIIDTRQIAKIQNKALFVWFLFNLLGFMCIMSRVNIDFRTFRCVLSMRSARSSFVVNIPFSVPQNKKRKGKSEQMLMLKIKKAALIQIRGLDRFEILTGKTIRSKVGFRVSAKKSILQRV